MYKDKLIKTVHMDCPICDQIHDVEMHTRIATLQIKKDRVSYKETYFICHNTNNEECEFQTAKLVRDNLLNARDSYRRKNNLLTSTDIVNIRKKYKLSQVELAKLLGWGEATISRYETKAIQDEAHDMMLKIIRDDPLKALELLRRNKNKFSSKKYLEIKEQIVNEINTRGKEELSRLIYKIFRLKTHSLQ